MYLWCNRSMNNFELHEPNDSSSPTKPSSRIEIALRHHEDITEFLIQRIHELERFAIPDLRKQTLSRLRLIEPLERRIQGDVSPAIHYLDMTHEVSADDYSRTEIKVGGRTLTLTSNPLEPLNDWSITRKGAPDESLSHAELLSFLQNRLAGLVPPLVTPAFKTAPADDHTVIQHIIKTCSPFSEDYSDARLYGTDPFMTEQDPIHGMMGLSAELSIVYTRKKPITIYNGHLDYEFLQHDLRESYNYTVMSPLSPTLPPQAKAALTLQSASASRAQLRSRTYLQHDTLEEALTKTADLVAQHTYNVADESYFG